MRIATRLSSLVLLAVSLLSADDILPKRWLNKTARHWQAVLQLQDWRVNVVEARLEDLPDGTVGASTWRLDGIRIATIAVLDPRDYAAARKAYPILKATTPRGIRDETEDTILHELLHIRLSALVRAPVPQIQTEEEIAVVRLTTAMLRKGKQ